jgi:carbonic anhydrase
MPIEKSDPTEKPQNGLAGLKHWRHDLVAGLLVSLISLPFSLGIAVASGAPPIAGIMSAILAGLVLPFLGGSYVTISGPAAGLAPVLLASMAILGGGNSDAQLAVGYPLLLGVICLTGLVQIVLSKFKAARFSAFFPSAVVEGMLASIGLLIIAKQLPHLLGHPFRAHDFFPILAEVPSQIRSLEPKVFGLAIACLVMVFTLASFKAAWLKAVPPQVIVVAIAIVLGFMIGFDANSKYLIHIPDQPFKNGIALPNFKGLLATHSLWWSAFTICLTLTLIDGVESLATIAAIDRVDPFRRKSSPDRTLFAMGVSNIVSSMAGGLTIIPGGVKSTACIQGGGRTQWANFYNACFLISFLLLGRGLINRMPYAALAAILIFTGFKLCRPKVWLHAWHIGSEQLFLFAFTIVVTLSTDLLIGIFAGMGAKLLLNTFFSVMVARQSGPKRIFTRIGDLFRNPVTDKKLVDGEYHMVLTRPLVCFNSLHVNKELDEIPADATSVFLHINAGVTVIDHTSYDNIMYFAEDYERSGRGRLQFVGLENMRMRSHHPTCMRLGIPALAANGFSTHKSTHAVETLHDSELDRGVIPVPKFGGVVDESASEFQKVN